MNVEKTPAPRPRLWPASGAALALGCALFLGCAANRESTSAREAEAMSAAPAEPTDEGTGERPASPDPAKGLGPAAEADAPGGEALPLQPKRKAEGLPQKELEEEADLEAADEAVVLPESDQKDPWQNLTESRKMLARALSPEQLSCSGARPYLEAICEIAARICDLEKTNPGKRQHCGPAQSACEEAKADFRRRCN